MKELVECIARSLVKNPDAVSVTVVRKGSMGNLSTPCCPGRHGKSDRETGTYCQGNPGCCQSGCIEGKQKSRCRYYMRGAPWTK